MAIIREMTKINVAVKAWRSPVSDSLNDNRCFNATADAGEKWMPMVKSLFDTDKTSLPELLGNANRHHALVCYVLIPIQARSRQLPPRIFSRIENTRCYSVL